MTGRLLIDGGLVVDGSGGEPFHGSVLIDDDRIVGVERGPLDVDAEVLDAAGSCVIPGLIDVHTHSDLSPFVDPWMWSALRQGVSTVVVGNCGSSAWPPAGLPDLRALTGIGGDTGSWGGIGAYLGAVDRSDPAVNVATLVGHGAIRGEVLGTARRAPDRAELGTMRSLARAAIDEGALGLSSGLVYVPGMYAATDELVALTAELAGSGTVYVSHVRGEGAHLFGAVAEAIEIGRRASVPTHLSHLKLEGAAVWDRAADLLAVIDTARADHDVTADQYPYTAWESELWSLLPPWVAPGSLDEVLRDRSAHDRLIRAIEHGEPEWQSSVEGVGWDRIVVSSHVPDPSIAGSSLVELAERSGRAPAEEALALLRADRATAVIGHAMLEDDVRAIRARPDVLVASDSTAMAPDGPLGADRVHPRTYGTFPRVLGPYVRAGVLSLADAVRAMTALPADRFGLPGRGRIEPGSIADLVVFDPAIVADTASFETPHRFPAGIDRVLVAGRTAWSRTGGAGERAGRALARGSD